MVTPAENSARDELARALDILAHIVSQANVNAVDGEDGFIARYNLPVGSIHKAIPFLQGHGITVDNYGYVHHAAHDADLRKQVRKEVAAEIRAEAEDTEDGEGYPAYLNGLLRAADLVEGSTT